MAKRKEKRPNDKSYHQKAKDLFMVRFRGMPCEICAKEEGTVGHHYVAQSRSKALKFDERNIIVLCKGHHNFGAIYKKTGETMGAHSPSSADQRRFHEWFAANHPDRLAWLIENEHTERRYTYKDAVANLKAGRKAWE